MIERDEERHRAGGERQAHQPAADRLAPAPPRERGRPDERGRHHELERQVVHRGTRPASAGRRAQERSASRRIWAGCLARRPARCSICWRQETPGATISVSAAADFTAGARRRLPRVTETS